MAHILALLNQKGGTGKSFAAASICYELAVNRGARVLAIDADPQRNLCFALGDNSIAINDDETMCLRSALDGVCELGDLIVHTKYENLDLIRSSGRLYGWADHPTGTACITQEEFIDCYDDPAALRDLIEEKLALPPKEIAFSMALNKSGVLDDYDWIIIDSNPSLNLLTKSILNINTEAKTELLVPCTADKNSYEAAKDLYDSIRAVRMMNPQLRTEILGLFVNRVRRTNLHEQMYAALSALAEEMGTVLFRTRVRDSVNAAEAATMGVPIGGYFPNSKLAEDIRLLTDEILERIN